MAAVKARGLKPIVLTGERARTFLPPSGAGINTIDFAAIFSMDDGGAAVFFGNVSVVCGPFLLSKEQVLRFWRPA